MGVTDAVGGLLQTVLLKIFVDLQTQGASSGVCLCLVRELRILTMFWGLQEHPGEVLTTHFGRYRDFGLYTDSLAFYGSRMFYYVWDLPIFVGMGAIGGLMGALFIKVNVKITQFRHVYIPVR